MSLALQATAMHLIVHPMEGFDYERAYEVAAIPRDDYEVEAMIALGYPGDPEKLPEHLRARERPNGRKPIEELAFEGRFGE